MALLRVLDDCVDAGVKFDLAMLTWGYLSVKWDKQWHQYIRQVTGRVADDWSTIPSFQHGFAHDIFNFHYFVFCNVKLCAAAAD